MRGKINVMLGVIIVVLLTLIGIWYVRHGKSTFILYRSIQKMNKASSYEVQTDIDIGGEVSLLGTKQLNSTFQIDSKVVRRPSLRVKQDYHVQVLNMNPTLTEHYIIEDHDHIFLYTKNPLSLQRKWNKRLITTREASRHTDLELLGLLMTVSKEVDNIQISEDLIDHLAVTEIEIELCDHHTKQLVNYILNSISENPLSKEMIININKALDHTALKLYIYIDQKTDYIYKIESDLTSVIARVLEEDDITLNIFVLDLIKKLSSSVSELDAFKVEIVFNKYNNTDFNVPKFN